MSRDDLELPDGGLSDALGPVETVIVDDVPDDEPERPDAANYLLDAVDRQDSDTLREVARYALELAAHNDRDLEPDELDESAVVDDGEELVDVSESTGSKGCIVTKKISCNKPTCTSCPHGPYRFRNYRENGEHHSEYLGKA